MKNLKTPVAAGSLAFACRHALQWRLLLLWTLMLTLPTLIVTLPIWTVMHEAFDYSVYADQIAARFEIMAMGDFVSILQQKSPLVNLAGLAAIICTVLLSPFLTGMAITALRAEKAAGFAALIEGGVKEYGRMLRLLIVGLIPIGLAGAAVAGMHKAISKYSDKAILESETDVAFYFFLALALLLLVIAHASVDAGRAQFALDTHRRSAFKAWWAGIKMVFTRPLTSLGFYLGISLLGLALVAGLIWLRINVPHVELGGFLFALLVMQLMMAVVAWMRNARLFALVAVARAQQNIN